MPCCEETRKDGNTRLDEINCDNRVIEDKEEEDEAVKGEKERNLIPIPSVT